MKPMLFNAEMVRALLDNRKTVTRRVIKPQPNIECTHGGQHEFIRDDFIEESDFTGFVCKKCGHGVCGPHFKFPIGTSWIRPPYRPGDILYVRETWYYETFYEDTDNAPDLSSGNRSWRYVYKADNPDYPVIPGHWRPSIHMPKEAARIFLRVTDVRVERVQDITEGDARKEGFVNDIDLMGGTGKSAARHFADLWGTTIKKPSDRALYGWDANPWVWVIEFERISREEALASE